jgi:hypothetical protein
MLIHGQPTHLTNEPVVGKRFGPGCVQRDKWGRLDGETCVIELSGLAARNFTVPRDRESFRQQRVAIIRERIVQNSPELVVRYGTSEVEHWTTIAGGSFPNENVARRGNTIFASTPHPTSYGMTNEYWTSLGSTLRVRSLASAEKYDR